ncbi:BgTH12-00605 [Blumeria graminis f. sp. triticale]|uniref:BgTH12-00605 n=1 Tax=Blumeria graminis f. sp. triticale TaxID=1689686 RepID=A0A9W4DNK9_BLUGR|nr:BgTH12-00605 [Blumeria graminis f. sp. triticale]
MKAVHFGAGNIGRGFVAEFLYNSGYEIVFCDISVPLVNRLNEQKKYKVVRVGGEGMSEVTITNYRAINTQTNATNAIEEIMSADLVTCSVGPKVLEFIAPIIAKGIDGRSNKAPPVTIIACENAIAATETLANYVRDPSYTDPDRLSHLNERAKFANSAIDRIVPAQNLDAGLDVKLELFYEWIVDLTSFQGHSPPKIDGVKWVENLAPYIERKLFTVNTGHATAAYYGYVYQKATVYDALQDILILEEVKNVLKETSELITSKYCIKESEHEEYVKSIIKRISNPYLEDTIERVGRCPLRKLGRDERFIRPAVELARDGRSIQGILRAIEMAFRFQNVDGDDESREMASILKDNCPEEVVKRICGLKSDEVLFGLVVDAVKKVQADDSEGT